jgi:hypothetical protein
MFISLEFIPKKSLPGKTGIQEFPKPDEAFILLMTTMGRSLFFSPIATHGHDC